MEIDKLNPEPAAGKKGKENFTAERITGYKCVAGKKQSLYWDAKTPGLGLRVTSAGAKAYIFETSLHGKTLRMTIGDPRTWLIKDAQSEATRLKAQTDQGIDPRQVMADALAAKEANASALLAKELKESVTVGQAWADYLKARKPFWGDRHYDDHVEMMHLGGEKRKRHTSLTEPGALASLNSGRLVDLTTERVIEWSKIEASQRAGRARLAYRQLKAFIAWCTTHATYGSIISASPTSNKDVKEVLGKQKTLDDVLQREQLAAWFTSVKQNCSPLVSAYLQALLLTGARPNELTELRWKDVDFQWYSMTIRDKVDGFRVIPLTPYLAQQLKMLPRKSQWIFDSPNAESGHLTDPLDAHHKACAVAGLYLTLYGLRRSFATLSEWIEMPSGIAAQIQGHAPSGVREKHYIRRPLDLLRKWHVQIEAWILEQAGIDFSPTEVGLHVVKK